MVPDLKGCAKWALSPPPPPEFSPFNTPPADPQKRERGGSPGGERRGIFRPPENQPSSGGGGGSRTTTANESCRELRESGETNGDNVSGGLARVHARDLEEITNSLARI